MKKLFLFLAFLCCTSLNSKAVPSDVTFVVEIFGQGGVVHPLPKSPVNPPVVALEDYVLTFESSHPDYTLTLLDEDGEVVYQTIVVSGMNSVVLPTWLSGEYELQLYPDGTNYYYYGFIYL